ncbi:unnamed protein product [Moneuplotes crassus]|uniref:Uncharacterized protein n=1 Tax=Euplotes crassus TaxID=5936 RepID=A0AAD1UAB3_EUPCR|nr:unnamed protein product [Moneuplotes crassus]
MSRKASESSEVFNKHEDSEEVMKLEQDSSASSSANLSQNSHESIKKAKHREEKSLILRVYSPDKAKKYIRSSSLRKADLKKRVKEMKRSFERKSGGNQVHSDRCKVYFKNQRGKAGVRRIQKFQLPPPQGLINPMKIYNPKDLAIHEKYQKWSSRMKEARNQNDILEIINSSFEEVRHKENSKINNSVMKPANPMVSTDSLKLTPRSPKMARTSKNKSTLGYIKRSKLSKFSGNFNNSTISSRKFKASNSVARAPRSVVLREKVLRHKKASLEPPKGDQLDWNSDISITNIEYKLADALQFSIDRKDSPLKSIQKTYVRRKSPMELKKMSEILQLRYLKLTDSYGKLEATGRKEAKQRSPKKLIKYQDDSKGIFQQKLELLKQNMKKEYFKEVSTVKAKNGYKGTDKKIHVPKPPLNFQYEALPQIHGSITPMENETSKENMLKISEKGFTLSLPNHLKAMKTSLEMVVDAPKRHGQGT